MQMACNSWQRTRTRRKRRSFRSQIDLLFKLDHRPVRIGVRDAEALVMAKLKAEALKAIYLQRLSNENVAQDALA
jgi:multidrug resistance efflux pump